MKYSVRRHEEKSFNGERLDDFVCIAQLFAAAFTQEYTYGKQKHQEHKQQQHVVSIIAKS